MKKLSLALVASLALVQSAAGSADAYWKIRKDRWTPADERGYSEFVQKLGESRCGTIEKCLKNPANPYRGTDPADAAFYSDCADLPYVLRSYYAWKNNLPFSAESSVASIGGGNDIRYSPNGNRVSGRQDFVSRANGQFPIGLRIVQSLGGNISSAMYRIDPRQDDAALFTDMYSPAITRESIVPGTVIYDPNGHVAVIYKIEKDGRVLFMDAHPDNSISRGTYGMKFGRSRPAAGAGFKRWRPLILTGYSRDSQGNLIGGRITALRNSQIGDYSTEQFFGNAPSPSGEWSKGRFVINGQNLDYYDYVRRRLAVGELKYEPTVELKNMLDALCQDLQDRNTAVKLAIDAGIQNKEHPERLPYNIYGTAGEWEEFSSPSRDARLKTSFKEARDRTAEFLKLWQQGSNQISYSGRDLKSDLRSVYNSVADSCVVEYRRSNGQARRITMQDVIDRLFKLSFDPYHCIELRWGETDHSVLASCRDSSYKLKWYDGEQFLRNQPDRTYDARMDFSLEELFTWRPGNGIKTAPDVDLERLLAP